MTRTVIEAGPGTIRRLDVPSPATDAEMVLAALDAVDDPVALVGGRPVPVDALWRTVLRSLCGAAPESVVIVHPSGWAASRIARVSAAARAVADDVLTRDRAGLLAGPEAAVVVEIGPRLVVVTGTAVSAEPRTGPPDRMAAAAARRVLAMTAGSTPAVRVDAPSTVGGAVALAAMIAERLRAATVAVHVVDDARLARLASAAFATTEPAAPPRHTPRRPWIRVAPAAAAILLAALLWGTRRDAPTDALPTTFLVEGRITVEVPATWPAQRVTAGPGSARVVLTSPSNPQIALHVTQSAVPDETLEATAATLHRALGDQPPGVFVDFNPAGHRAGRPAVTYREVRAGHDIRWVILLDDAVRISIGCQSPPDDEDAVRPACELAVHSARAQR